MSGRTLEEKSSVVIPFSQEPAAKNGISLLASNAVLVPNSATLHYTTTKKFSKKIVGIVAKFEVGNQRPDLYVVGYWML